MLTVPTTPASYDLMPHRHPLHALTGIRLLAAYYVVFFHSRMSGIMYEHRLFAAGNFCRNGYLAVPLFFLLSGIILSYTYRSRIKSFADCRRFWEARFARIFPVYLLSLLFSTIPTFVFPTLGASIAAICMVQAWNPRRTDLYGTFNFMCWSLSVEAFFYLIFPTCQVRIEKFSKESQLLFLGTMIALCLAINTTSHTPDYHPQGLWSLIPLPFFHVPEFLTGVGVGNYLLVRLNERSTTTSRGLLASKGYFALGSGLWTYCALVFSIAVLCQVTPNRWMSLIIIGFAALLFGLAAERTLLSRFLSSSAMLLGGAISYSVYLMQLPIKDWVLKLANHMHVNSQADRMVLTTVMLALFSLFIYKAVEDPARKFLRRFFTAIDGKTFRRANE